jgi:hypothetical protein
VQIAPVTGIADQRFVAALELGINGGLTSREVRRLSRLGLAPT